MCDFQGCSLFTSTTRWQHCLGSELIYREAPAEVEERSRVEHISIAEHIRIADQALCLLLDSLQLEESLLKPKSSQKRRGSSSLNDNDDQRREKMTLRSKVPRVQTEPHVSQPVSSQGSQEKSVAASIDSTEWTDTSCDSSDEYLPTKTPGWSEDSDTSQSSDDAGTSRNTAAALCGAKRVGSLNRSEDQSWKQTHWRPKRIRFTAKPGPQGSAAELESDLPVDFLELFITNELLQHIVDETNANALDSLQENPCGLPYSRSHDWRPLTVEELKTFLGLSFITGFIKKPVLEDDWSGEEFESTPFFGQTMSRNRYQIIWRYLHFNGTTHDSSDKMHKVRPVLDYVVAKFKDLYTPKQNKTFV
ncbi:uncharacterized protein LOC144012191 isoform X1 [Festucalex cinctus]